MPTPTSLPKGVSVTMTLYQALEEAFNGHRIKRISWDKIPGGKDVFCCVRFDKVMIFKPTTQYVDWIISVDDMEGLDWIVVTEG